MRKNLIQQKFEEFQKECFNISKNVLGQCGIDSNDETVLLTLDELNDMLIIASAAAFTYCVKDFNNTLENKRKNENE